MVIGVEESDECLRVVCLFSRVEKSFMNDSLKEKFNRARMTASEEWTRRVRIVRGVEMTTRGLRMSRRYTVEELVEKEVERRKMVRCREEVDSGNLSRLEELREYLSGNEGWKNLKVKVGKNGRGVCGERMWF